MTAINSANKEKIITYLSEEKYELNIINEEKEYVLISILGNEIKLYKKTNGLVNLNSLRLLKDYALAVFKGGKYEQAEIRHCEDNKLCELKFMELPITKELYLAIYHLDMMGNKAPAAVIKTTIDDDNLNDFVNFSSPSNSDDIEKVKEVSAYYEKQFNLRPELFVYNFAALEFLKECEHFKIRDFYVANEYRFTRSGRSIYQAPEYFYYSKVKFNVSVERKVEKEVGEVAVHKNPQVTFNNVYCLDGIVEQFRELGEIITHYEEYEKKGVRLPYGILLLGEPGTGKTLITNAFINEFKLNRYDLSSEPGGRGEYNYGDKLGQLMFKARNSKKPAVIVIDEIDKMDIDHTFFQELNGQVSNRGIIVIATANSTSDINPALLRPGRFDRKIIFPKLNKETKMKMLEESISNREINHTLDLETMIELMNKPSPAAIDTYINEAKLQMVISARDVLTDDILMKAIDIVDNGINVPIKYSEDVLQKIRIHEAGHAIVALELYGPDSIAKIDTTPKPSYGGVVKLIDTDNSITNKEDLYKAMKIGLGGIVAEKLFDKDTSIGAVSDLIKVRNICEGFLVDYGLNDISSITARMFKFGTEVSKNEIIEESKQILFDVEREVTKILITHTEKHQALVKLLSQKEVLYRKDIVAFNNCYLTALN